MKNKIVNKNFCLVVALIIIIPSVAGLNARIDMDRDLDIGFEINDDLSVANEPPYEKLETNDPDERLVISEITPNSASYTGEHPHLVSRAMPLDSIYDNFDVIRRENHSLFNPNNRELSYQPITTQQTKPGVHGIKS